MREHLLGYLLGALDSPETDVLEDHLATDRQLQAELELLRGGLEPLDADRDPIEPPAGLATRTCLLISKYTEVSPAPVADPGERQAAASAGRWRLSDFAVAASVLIAAGMLFLPALSNSRSNARLLACQNNLKDLGAGLVNYSRQNNDLFPQIPLAGKMAAAGAYAPQLYEAGYVTTPNSIVCPASELADDRMFTPPSQKDIMGAEGEHLTELRRKMGGSYGYTLGYQDANHVYHPTRNRSRERYALMADAPNLNSQHFQSSNHGGDGQNVLFEDGKVKYLKNCHLTDCRDEIFSNDEGKMAPGTHVDDAVIGHSALTPETWSTAELH
jgi:hypothetical protein